MSTTTASETARFEAHVAKHMPALAALEGHRPGLPEDEARASKGGRRVSEEVAQRRRRVVELVQQGMQSWQIAAKLNASYEAIRTDRKLLKREGLL